MIKKIKLIHENIRPAIDSYMDFKLNDKFA